MKREVLADNFSDFVGQVVAAGMTRDKLRNVSRSQLLKLFQIYYAEIINGTLNLPIESNDENIGFSLKKSVKKLGKSIKGSVKNLIKNPLAEVVDIATKPLEFIGGDAKKLSDKLEESSAIKSVDKAVRYAVKNPQAAIAFAAATLSGVSLPMALARAGVAGVSKELSNKTAKANEEMIKTMMVESEATGQINLPDSEVIGNPQEILKIIDTKEYYDNAYQQALNFLVSEGHDRNNPATQMLADQAVKTSIADIKQKIGAQKQGSALILPIAVAALTLLQR